MAKKYRNKGNAAYLRSVNKANARPEYMMKAVDITQRRSNALGTEALAYFQQIVDQLQPYELKWPQSMRTFEAMKNDDAVAAVLNLNYCLIESAFSTMKITYNKKSPASKQAAEFLEHALHNMNHQTFIQVIRSMSTFKEKGFSVTEKTYRQYTSGKYAGKWGINKLANRPQISLSDSVPFEIVNGGSTIRNCRQKTNFFENRTEDGLQVPTVDITPNNAKKIARGRFILLGDGASESTPLGNPILRACYKPWKEKLLLEELEVNGASKDLAGIIQQAIPYNILKTAADDPESVEAKMVNKMMDDARNIHAGEQASFIIPSDLQDGSTQVPAFSTKILGIDGAGRQFDPGEMVQKRRKAIFDIFGAGYVLTGEGSVSYNSAEVKSSTHMDIIKRDIRTIEDGFNEDLIPQLLNIMNNMNLDWKDLPKIKAGEIHPISYDDLSKYGQRLGAVGFLPKVPEVVQTFVDRMGADYQVPEDSDPDDIAELTGQNQQTQSRSGDGMKSGLSNGTGGSTSSGNDRSVSNQENKSLNNLRIDENGVYQVEKHYYKKEELPEDIAKVFEL